MDQPARFVCVTCPYVANLQNGAAIRRKHLSVKKPPDPISTLEDRIQGGAETEATCPHCYYGRARFQQMQIKSADEAAKPLLKRGLWKEVARGLREYTEVSLGFHDNTSHILVSASP